MTDIDNSCVYGLRHQARCLTPVVANTECSKFLVGTVGAQNNSLCLLEYDDEKNTITPTLFDHPEEIWDLVSSPTNEDLLLTCHSIASNRTLGKKITLWKKNSLEQNHGELESLVEFEHPGHKALWDSKDASCIVSLNDNHIHISSLDASNMSSKTILSIDTSIIFKEDTKLSPIQSLQNAVWNPHDNTEIVTVGGQVIAGWDIRSSKATFRRDEAHASTIRAIDYNANKPFHIATGGDDSKINLWDVRSMNQPLMVVEGHTHWIWSVAFNKFHDQLLLTSSSDTLVNLQNVISVSSASYLEHETDQPDDDQDPDESYWKNYKTIDGLICTYDQHEDSVYSVAWSPADTWTFASLSYAGRVVISQVPTGEKFKILGV
ncbi:WD40-repeat-containing domain protein [Cunninghamella echinulata]|nr:WD40-repeat-containing domain protein [Cunninghamella echinulata]